MTRRFVLFYISTKYHKNIPKGIRTYTADTITKFSWCEEYSSYRADTKSIANKTKGDNSKSKKTRVAILVRDTSSYPILHFSLLS